MIHNRFISISSRNWMHFALFTRKLDLTVWSSNYSFISTHCLYLGCTYMQFTIAEIKYPYLFLGLNLKIQSYFETIQRKELPEWIQAPEVPPDLSVSPIGLSLFLSYHSLLFPYHLWLWEWSSNLSASFISQTSCVGPPTAEGKQITIFTLRSGDHVAVLKRRERKRQKGRQVEEHERQKKTKWFSGDRLDTWVSHCCSNSSTCLSSLFRVQLSNPHTSDSFMA